MPEISRFYGIVINGKLPNLAKLLVVEWALINRRELLENWKRARNLKALKEIKPLR